MTEGHTPAQGNARVSACRYGRLGELRLDHDGGAATKLTSRFLEQRVEHTTRY